MSKEEGKNLLNQWLYWPKTTKTVNERRLSPVNGKNDIILADTNKVMRLIVFHQMSNVLKWAGKEFVWIDQWHMQL